MTLTLHITARYENGTIDQFHSELQASSIATHLRPKWRLTKLCFTKSKSPLNQVMADHNGAIGK